MDDTERRVDLRSVARQAGVSLGTASNALAGKPRVAPATREAVISVAAQLGYERRPRAPRPLRLGVDRLGLVIRHGMPPTENPFYSHVLHGAQAACAARGIVLSYEVLPDSSGGVAKLPLMLEQGQVQGLLVVGYVRDSFLRALQGTGKPFVLIDYAVSPPVCDTVCGDDEAGAYLATTHLLDHAPGDRPPAAVVGPLSHSSFRDRLSGYRRALNERGLAPPDGFVRTWDSGATRAQNLNTLLDMLHPPTAVFCANDDIAIHVLAALRDRGRRVPQDCAVIGFDDIAWASRSSPPLSTIHVDKEALGAQGVWHLLERIERPEMSFRQTRLAVTLVERASVALLP